MVQLSLEAGLLVLAVIWLRWIFRKAPKWLHCLMWAVVAVKLICPFGIESEASSMPRSDVVKSSVESAASISEPFGELSAQQPIQQKQPGESNVTGIQSHSAPSETQPVDSGTILPTVARTGSWIWLTGMSGILLYAAASYLSLRRRLADAVPSEDGIDPSDRIYRSDRIQSAFLFGIIRPKIYFPYSIDGETMRLVTAPQNPLHHS